MANNRTHRPLTDLPPEQVEVEDKSYRHLERKDQIIVEILTDINSVFTW